MDKGTYVVVRATAAAAHAGVLQSQDGQVVGLTDARRLWRFRVPMGASQFLSGVSISGLDHGDSLIGAPVSEILILDACEVIACTAEAEASIRSAPVSERDR